MKVTGFFMLNFELRTISLCFSTCKTMKKIFTLLTFLSSFLISSAQEKIKIHLPVRRAGTAMTQIWQNSHNRVVQSALSGGLNFYRDPALKTVFSPEEMLQFTLLEETIQIINPANPDDPYDLIDTLISYPITEWTSFKLLDQVVMAKINETRTAYLKISDFKKIVGHEAFLYWQLWQKKAFDQDISFNKAHQIGIAWAESLMEKLYLITQQSNKLTKYLSDSLTTRITDTLALKEIIAIRENVSIINPINPNDPYDLIDSTIILIRGSTEMTGILLSLDYELEGHEMEYDITAMALSFSPVIGGIRLEIPVAWAWMKYEPCLAQLNKQDHLLINAWITIGMNKLLNSHWGVETE